MFAQTTHVVAAPHGFACVVIPAARLYIPSFIEIRSGVSEPRGVKIWPLPLLWLVAFSTACTTVQAVMRELQLNIVLPRYSSTGLLRYVLSAVKFAHYHRIFSTATVSNPSSLHIIW